MHGRGAVLVAMHVLIVANAVLLALAVGWLATFVVPVSRAVRVRNAFLLRAGKYEDFSWTPATMPGDFRAERALAPEAIAAAVSAAGIGKAGDDWPRALALVTMLVRHSQREGALQADLETTLRGIEHGSGHCVDFVRVFLASAHAAGLFCRQWAFSFDGFGGHGHTFVEVFDRKRGRWAAIDVHNNVYPVVAGSDEPLGALALRSALVNAPASIEFRRAGAGRLGYPHPEKLLAYYRRGIGQWYLWWGNDVVSRERAGLTGVVGRVSSSLAYRVGSAIGGMPKLVAVVTPENRQLVTQMHALRRRVTAAVMVVAGLGLLLALQFAADWLRVRHA